MGGRGATQSERGVGRDGRKDYRMVKKAAPDPEPKQWTGGYDAAWKENLNIGDEVLLLFDRDGDLRRVIKVELDFSGKQVGWVLGPEGKGKVKPPIGGLAWVGYGSVGLILEWG
ncbi:hypothetical protein ACFX13_013676 [Malus domestica]|uniref:Uncharacterized protein n=1 Tax=Malus domestica TaxID=3750 RepID=A0A498I9K7_MALDO|nr:hypothetical protein DVH24_006964 [Malus domestica]